LNVPHLVTFSSADFYSFEGLACASTCISIFKFQIKKAARKYPDGFAILTIPEPKNHGTETTF